MEEGPWFEESCYFFFLNQTTFSIQLEKKAKQDRHVKLFGITVARNTAEEKMEVGLKEKKKCTFPNILREHPKF